MLLCILDVRKAKCHYWNKCIWSSCVARVTWLCLLQLEMFNSFGDYLEWVQLLTVTIAMTDNKYSLPQSFWLFSSLSIAINTVACKQRDLNVMFILHCPTWTRTCPLCSCHVDTVNHFPRYWPFVRGIHRSPVNSPSKGQWRGDFMFSLICVWTYGWVNNRDAGDLRRHRAHYDVAVIPHDICTRWCPLVFLYSRTKGEVRNQILSFTSFFQLYVFQYLSHMWQVSPHIWVAIGDTCQI